MADFKIFLCLLFAVFCQETLSMPFDETNFKSTPNQRFRMFIPSEGYQRQRRAEEQQSGGSGVQQFLTTAIKDGIAASSAMDSPTMFIGGFSVMMQPMPNGTEFSGQLMQMAPHYMNLLPGFGGNGGK